MLLCAAYSFGSGAIQDKLGMKAFIVITFFCGMLANTAMVLFLSTGRVVMIVLLVIFCMFGYPATSFSNYIASDFFGTKMATEANALLIAFTYISNSIMSPAYIKLATATSFKTMYIVSAPVSIVAMICYLYSYNLGQKRKHTNLPSDAVMT